MVGSKPFKIGLEGHSPLMNVTAHPTRSGDRSFNSRAKPVNRKGFSTRRGIELACRESFATYLRRVP